MLSLASISIKPHSTDFRNYPIAGNDTLCFAHFNLKSILAMRIYFTFLTIFITCIAWGQDSGLNGNVLDGKSHLPVQGVTIYIIPDGLSTFTNATGNFQIRTAGIPASIMISGIGYATKLISFHDFLEQHNTICLEAVNLELSAVT